MAGYPEKRHPLAGDSSIYGSFLPYTLVIDIIAVLTPSCHIDILRAAPFDGDWLEAKLDQQFAEDVRLGAIGPQVLGMLFERLRQILAIRLPRLERVWPLPGIARITRLPTIATFCGWASRRPRMDATRRSR